MRAGDGEIGDHGALPPVESVQAEASLETPNERAKPKGLVKRKGFYVVAIVFIGVLVGFMVRDMVSEDRPTGSKAVAARGTPANPASAAEFTAPVVKELDEKAALADSTAATAPSAEGAPASGRVAPNFPQMKGVNRPDPNSPTKSGRPAADAAGADGSRGSAAQATGDDLVGSSNGGGAVQADALAERRRSSLVSLEGDDAPVATQQSSAGRIPAAPEPSASPEADQVMRSAGESQAQQMAMLQQALAGGKPGLGPAMHRTSSDREWLKQQASASPELAGEGVFRPLPVLNPATAGGRWIVLSGTRLPAVTLEAVNSDLPGSVSARVTADVFDSLTQTQILVPRGSRINLNYSSEIRPGQARVLFASSRLVRPDGLVIDLSGGQGSDRLGRSGIEGNVNNHFLQMFGYSLATALISSKVSNSGPTSTTFGPNGQATTTSVVGQVLGEVSNRILARNAEIPPTITLPMATPITIVVARDFALPPYGANR